MPFVTDTMQYFFLTYKAGNKGARSLALFKPQGLGASKKKYYIILYIIIFFFGRN
jgi:hypothetical protein